MPAANGHHIRIDRFGGPQVLKWRPRTVGEPGVGEVRIRHAAVGLNYLDIYHRTGLYEQPLPLTPGVEAAGIVEAVGSGVSHLKAGDRVAYVGPIGAYADLRLINADALVRLPDGLSFDHAAAVLLKGLTAQMLVRQVYPVAEGETILVHAAAGGTGLLICQWAASLGARVIGTVSSESKAEIAAAHGCHHPIVTTRTDFVEEVSSLTAGEKLPVVFDSVGQSTFLKSLDCLKPRGMMVTFGQSSGPIEPFAPSLLAQKGSLYLTRPVLFTYIATRAQLENAAGDLFQMLDTGKLQIEINQRFPLPDAARAHEALESRKTTGSSILTV